MTPSQPTRRDFLSASGSAAMGAWLLRAAPFLAVTQACADESARTGAAWTTFTDREAADFDAFAGRIIPATDTPGAREAGVTRFADHALDTFFADILPIVRPGLADLADRAEGAGGTFDTLSEDEQDDIIRSIEAENPGFFFFGKTVVTTGFMANAEYGSDPTIGYALIGFEPRFGWEPPFGSYDQDEHGQAEGDA